MSILDSIQVAEQKAEKMRFEATENVKILLEKAKVESENKAHQMLKEATLEENKIYEDLKQTIIKKEKEINSVYEKQDDILAARTDSRIDIAVDLIVKKVFEL